MKNLKNVQQALINIFKASIKEGPLEKLVETCHKELEKLMGIDKTKNFYLAMHQGDYQYVLPYFQDEKDSQPVNEPYSLRGGLTDYIRRTGKTEAIDMQRRRQLMADGEIEIHLGKTSCQWVGAPLVYGGEVRGVLAVQTYEQHIHYANEDVQLLDYVSESIALALERKDKDRELHEYKKNLERKVKESSNELLKRNAELEREISKVKNSEEIQKVLYNISEAKSNTGNLRELLVKIHEQVSGLMKAVNFYVAIVVDKDEGLYRFPYIVDENPQEIEEPENIVNLSGGFTHYVLRTGKPLLADKKKVNQLREKGEVAFLGKSPQSWLGIPLKTDGGEILGVVVVQSYDDPDAYSHAHKNILSIISTTIAGGVKFKQLEEKKRILEEKLLEAQKMEAVGILAAGVAHEFNNLLSIIIGHAFNGMKDNKDSDDYNRYKKIEKTGEQAAELVEKLMVFAKKRERGGTAINDMGRVINEIVMNAKQFAPVGCDVSITIKAPLWLLRIEWEELNDILSNIIDNAFRAVEANENGFVKVTVENFNGRPVHSLLKDTDKYIHIKIEDNGYGMDEEIRNQIFNPFFTTREPGQGTGMGLAIVYTIIQEYYGTIDVESEKGKGTVFHIYLPTVSFFS